MLPKQLSLFDNDDWFRPFNKPETLSSLAAKYSVTYETFRKWLEPIKDQIRITPRRTFTPAEVREIIRFLGEYGA
ncbi:MAG: DUF4248 domain-containing protein [Bacteroidetes bacterium]|nr:DUF4248 domain-containing protein [Bacteroidota bacterium]